jgi:hypothetical protein
MLALFAANIFRASSSSTNNPVWENFEGCQMDFVELIFGQNGDARSSAHSLISM